MSMSNSTTRDRLFTRFVNMIQQYVTPWGVRWKMSRRARIVAPPSADLRARLSELGLDVDSLWWGPMTLHPRKIEYLIREVESHPPRCLLEVGSGSSTPVLAALAHRYGFHVVSLENHAGSARYVCDSMHQGAEQVDLVVTGFRRRYDSDGKPYWWYDVDLSGYPQPFDMVLIDGPMGSLVGRGGALREIKPFLAPDHRIYIDDANRDHEKKCIAHWQRQFKGLNVELPVECRGIAKLRILNS